MFQRKMKTTTRRATTRIRSTLGWSLSLQVFVFGCQAQAPVIQPQNQLPPAQAEILETGVIEGVPGFRGDELGAEVLSVSEAEDERLRVIELSIPVDPERVDQVSVVGPSGQLLDIRRPIEISADPENNKVGITLTLSKQRSLGFRIQLIDLPEEQ